MLLTKSFPTREHEISAHLANQSRASVSNDFFERVKQLNRYNFSESMICPVIVTAKQLSSLTKKFDRYGFILRQLSRTGVPLCAKDVMAALLAMVQRKIMSNVGGWLRCGTLIR